MPRFACLVLLALLAVSALFAASKPAGPERITVARLEQSLAAAHGQTDAQVGQQLVGLELTERLSAAKFAQLTFALPGEKSKQGLLILADQAAFLTPPRPPATRRSARDGSGRVELLAAPPGRQV